jgi:RHS repeat-associated protein
MGRMEDIPEIAYLHMQVMLRKRKSIGSIPIIWAAVLHYRIRWRSNPEYGVFPSGEIFVENHMNDGLNSQYKFNGKEQDGETGYYYYGARYYNPRVSLWLNVDPLSGLQPLL